jgi:uncharacterized protein YabE (DUF348 family)
MSPQRIRWLAAGAAVIVLLFALLSWQKDVVVLADGAAYPVTSRALTVAGAVSDAGLELGPQDQLTPGSLTFLRSGLIIDVQRAAQVLLRADGQELSLVSTERDPATLLAEFDVELGPEDRLLLAGESQPLDTPIPYSANLLLEVRRAVTISLTEDGQSSQFRSSAPTLGIALAEEGVDLLASDDLKPGPETVLDSDLQATLTRSRPVAITLGDEVFDLRSTAATVGEALAEAGVALQGLDVVEPQEAAPVPEDGHITVHRIYETVSLTQQPIEFSTEWAPDPEIEIDNQSVVQLGQYGVEAQRTRVRYEDGVEVAREDEGSWTLVDPVTQVRGYGTDIVIRSAVVDGVTIEYWRAVTLYVTSYSPCRSGVPDKCYYYTALGDEVKKGIAAVYLDWWYQMGNHTVYVPGYGHAKISDNGAYPDGRPWIDLAYSDDDWVPWGGWYTVYFTTPVPPEYEIIWVLP